MKKFFSFVAAALVSLSMFATKVTFDFTDTSFLTAQGFTLPAAGQGTDLDGQSFVKDGVTISFVKGTASTTCRIFQGSGGNEGKYDVRTYAGNTMTISVAGSDKINEVQLGVNMTCNDITASNHTFTTGVVSADFTGKANLSTINVIINESVVVWTPDTVTVSQAIALAGQSDVHDHYVFGRVMSTPFAAAGKNALWIADLSTADSLEVYDFAKSATEAWASLDELKETIIEGDTILVHATSFAPYKTFFETTSAYYVATIGAAPRAPQKDVTINSLAVEVEEGFDFTIAVTVDGTPYTMEFYKDPVSDDLEALVGTYNIEAESMGSVTFAAGSTLTIAFVSTGVYSVSINAVDGEGLKYVGKNESVNVAGNFPKDNTSVDVLAAVEVAIATGTTATTTTYTIYGYVAKIKEAYSDQYKNISFYMSDNATATSGEFVAYRAKVADGAQVPVVGDCVKVTGAIVNYQGNTPETNGTTTCEIIDPATIPADIRHGKTPQTIDATVTEALTVGNALEQNASTFDMYHVIGYAIIAYEPDEKGEQTFYIAEAPIAGATATDAEKENSLMIQFTVPDATVAVGDQIDVVGKILHYYKAASGETPEKEYICIRNGEAKHVTTAIPQVIMNDSFNKAQKVVVDGKIVIIRNGVQYNAAGARL